MLMSHKKVVNNLLINEETVQWLLIFAQSCFTKT